MKGKSQREVSLRPTRGGAEELLPSELGRMVNRGRSDGGEIEDGGGRKEERTVREGKTVKEGR
jgi:hypothetical protein